MPLRFTLRQLEYFVAVGNEGSIAQASEKVNVSSPSISAAVAQLEEEFGLLLFVRKHAQGLSLTQAGKQFIKQAKKILAEANGLNKLAGDISGTVQGPLALGCLSTFAQLIVPDLRQKFEKQYPNIRVRQYEMHQLDIFDHLRRAEIDIALTYDLDIPSDINFIPLGELPPYILVGGDHPFAELKEITLEALKDHPMVLLDLPYSRDYFLSLFNHIGARPFIAERSRDMAVIRSLVANGFGYAIANIRPLNDRAPDGKALRFIPLSGKQRAMKMGLAVAEGTQNILSLKAFIEHCHHYIKDNSINGIKFSCEKTPL